MTANQEKINVRRKDMVQISDLAQYSSTWYMHAVDLRWYHVQVL